MIRPFTCVCLLLAGGSGLYLYQSKHRAQMLDREIGRVLRQTELARDRIGVLRAEWAVLNEPERLAELSKQHLGLRQLSPTQFVAVADLGARLPPVPVPGTHLTAPGEEPVALAVAVPVPPPVARPAPAPPPRVAAAPPPPAPLRAPAPVRPAPRTPEEPARAPVQLAAPAPVRSAPPVLNVAASPMMSAPRPATQAPGSIGESVMRASALGGARTGRPPPPPYNSP